MIILNMTLNFLRTSFFNNKTKAFVYIYSSDPVNRRVTNLFSLIDINSGPYRVLISRITVFLWVARISTMIDTNSSTICFDD